MFEKDGRDFGDMKVTDPDAIRRGHGRERGTGWDLVMEPILVNGEIRMGEVYRMI